MTDVNPALNPLPPPQISVDERYPVPTNLEGVLECIIRSDINRDGQITVAEMIDMIGHRSFGPLILLPSLIGLSPIGAIPGVPLMTSIMVMFFTIQILVGAPHIWLPGVIQRRSLPAARIVPLLEKFRPTTRFIDRLFMPRMTWLTTGPAFYVLAAFCFGVAVFTPLLELIPMAGIVPNAAIVAFALSMTARDGLWALIALGFTGGTGYLISESSAYIFGMIF